MKFLGAEISSAKDGLQIGQAELLLKSSGLGDGCVSKGRIRFLFRMKATKLEIKQ